MGQEESQVIEIEAMVSAALDSGDRDKAIRVLLMAILINHQNLERCADKLNEMIASVNLQQELLAAIIGSKDATKH